MSRAANVSFTFTNSFNQPDTNWFKVIPVSGPVAYADGSFTTIGLPIRVQPNTNGTAITNIPQNNYLVTNAFLGQGYYIRVPLDTGPTVYPSGQLRISGGNVFVTVIITNGTIASLTYQILTNALGGAPLFSTNLPALTNGFIAPVDFTNLFDFLIVPPTNGMTSIVYSNPAAFINLPIFTNTFNALAVPITNGMTSIVYSNPAAFTTPVTVTNITQALLLVATNGHIRLQDATNVFNALITSVTNVYGTIAYSNANAYTTIALLNSTSNALDSLISAGGGISAGTATNIASAATNGLISLRDATNVANAIVTLATNGIGSAAYSNAAAFYLSSNPNNYLSGLTITNAINALIIPATNTLAVSNDMQTRFTLKNGGVATNLFLKAPTFSSFSSDGGNISSDGSGNVTMLQELLAGKIDVTDGSFLDQHNISTDGAGDITAVSFSGVGSGLTQLNGTKITGVLTNNTTGNASSSTIATNLAAPGLTVVTNVAGLQGTNAANNQITNLVASILTTSNYQGAINTSSNGGWNANTNFGLTTFVLEQGGGATNTFVTNSPLISTTNFGIGSYPVIYQSTNLVGFISSGTSALTNSLYVWAGAGAGLNYYTNVQNGGWITNNGTLWQVYSSTAVQLFSNTKLTGSWTLQGGTGAAVSDYGDYLRGDGLFIVGLVNSTNITTNILNGAGGIATLSGHGTNTYLTNIIVDWNGPTPSENFSQSQGALLNFQSASFGQANTNQGGGLGVIIAGGASNRISSAGDSFIGAGIGNFLGGGFNNGDFLGAGISNSIGGVDRSFLGAGMFNTQNGGDSFLGSGFKNNIGSVSYSAIVTGNSNTVGSSYSFIGAGTNNTLQSQAGAILTGFNNQIINSQLTFVNVGNIILGGSNNLSSNAWWNLEWGQNISSTNQWDAIFSDSQVNTITNSQAILKFTNGVAINTNNAGGNALQVLGTVAATGGFSVQGTNVTVLNTSPNVTTPTNLNMAGATFAYQDTNNIAFTNAGTSAANNGLLHWFAAQGQFSNTVNGEILTNNSGTFNLYSSQGGSVLYSTNVLISSPWALNAGAGPGPGSYYAPTVDSHAQYVGYIQPTNVLRILSDTNANINTNGILVAALAGVSSNQTLFAPTNIGVVRATVNGTNTTFMAASMTALAFGAAFSNALTMASNAMATATTGASGRLDVGPGSFDLTGMNNVNLPVGLAIYGSGQGVTLFTNQVNASAFPAIMKGSNTFAEFTCLNGMFISDPNSTSHPNNIVKFVTVIGGDSPLQGDGYFSNNGRLMTNVLFGDSFSSCFDAFNVDCESFALRNAQMDFSIYNTSFNAISTTNTSSLFNGETVVRAFAITSASNSIFRLFNCNLNAQSIILSNGVVEGYNSALSFGKPIGSSAYLNGCQVWLKGCNLNSQVTNGFTGGNWDIDFQPVSTNCSVFVDSSTVFSLAKVNWAGTSNFIYFVNNGQTNGYIQDGHYVFTPASTAANLPTNSLGLPWVSNSPAGGTNSVYIPWNSNGTIYNMRFLMTLQ